MQNIDYYFRLSQTPKITNTIDVSEWADLKGESLNKHRTQMNPESPFAKMPPDLIATMRSQEHYALAKGVPLPDTDDAKGDLFAGLRD